MCHIKKIHCNDKLVFYQGSRSYHSQAYGFLGFGNGWTFSQHCYPTSFTGMNFNRLPVHKATDSFNSTLSLIYFAKLLQSCLTLCAPMDCHPPGSSVHGIILARTLEWVAISCSSLSSWLELLKELRKWWEKAKGWEKTQGWHRHAAN